LATSLTFTEEARNAMSEGAQAEPGRTAPKEYGDPEKEQQQDPQLKPNMTNLEDVYPDVVKALKDLMVAFRNEGIVARRHQIRKAKQARLFWQGLHYSLGWDADNMDWRMPFGSGLSGAGLSFNDDKDAVEGGRYQFVTNFYQGFGLSFIAVVSQDVPSIEWYPQSAQSEEDIATAKAASDIEELIAQNNRVERLLAKIGYFLWTDGSVCAYVRYVADGQRFGFHDVPQMSIGEKKMGQDAFVCPSCGAETPPGNLFAGSACPQCGWTLGQKDFREAPMVQVPQITSVRKVPNGQEVISIFGELEVDRPVYADSVEEMSYLRLTVEVHEGKLRAAYPDAADKIKPGNPNDADDVYARASRVSVKQGLPTTHPGDALYSQITFDRNWFEPWTFFSERVPKEIRPQLLKLFPDGAYCAFAGDTFCEARNENKADHWRILQALEGDGQNRPAVGTSLISVQERYNILSNIVQEREEFGIPPIYADPQVLDFDALADQTAEPGAHYPARARNGQPLAAGFFQPAPTNLSPDTMLLLQDLMGPVAQFLTGLFPAIWGGEMPDQKTASGYSMARDQAMGRLGLIWRGIKYFWADVMLLAVDCFRKNRPEDVEMPILGEDSEYEAKVIRMADLKGNLQARPEADETFPRLKSQQRAVLTQMLAGANENPMFAELIQEPANQETISRDLGMKDLVIPGKDSRDKALRTISLLLTQQPLVIQGQPDMQTGAPGQPQVLPSVAVDELDRHDLEFAECVRWANSASGQKAKMSNPAGYANVKAYAMAQQAAMQKPGQEKPPSESINFKDLTPGGKVQMAGQAGIQLNPLELIAKDEQDRKDKKDELNAKVNAKPKEKAA
jgi:hypothetical protein